MKNMFLQINLYKDTLAIKYGKSGSNARSGFTLIELMIVVVIIAIIAAIALPAYTEFCKIKKQYQLNQVSIEAVTTGIKDVCKEIYEFLQTLYNNSDIAEERHILVQSIKDFLDNI